MLMNMIESELESMYIESNWGSNQWVLSINRLVSNEIENFFKLIWFRSDTDFGLARNSSQIGSDWIPIRKFYLGNLEI